MSFKNWTRGLCRVDRQAIENSRHIYGTSKLPGKPNIRGGPAGDTLSADISAPQVSVRSGSAASLSRPDRCLGTCCPVRQHEQQPPADLESNRAVTIGGTASPESRILLRRQGCRDVLQHRFSRRMNYTCGMIEKLSPNTAASLRSGQHIYCAGTVAQCLHRWDKLPSSEKDRVFLSIRQEGDASATRVERDELQKLATDPNLRDKWLR